jgi:hypothetical protein
MPPNEKFHRFLFKRNKYLFSKFQEYISIEYRESKKTLILNMRFAPAMLKPKVPLLLQLRIEVLHQVLSKLFAPAFQLQNSFRIFF